MAGPLEGIRVVEFAGLGPGPFCAMMLSDMGAEVLRIDRPDHVGAPTDGDPNSILARGRRSVAIDLKSGDGVRAALELIDRADALIEGFRPGVMERLGLGPEICHGRNPRLVYGRMTGWGQDGPLAARAGHDINYIAVAGVLHAIGRAGEVPVPPLNLVADFGGGGMLLAFGIACALIEARRSGVGQTVDAAMVDGAALLSAHAHGGRNSGHWVDGRGENLLDSGAYFYEVYRTADAKFVAVGAIEPQFYDRLMERLGLQDEVRGIDRMDRSLWPAMKARLAEIFETRTRDDWCELIQDDCCFAPVLSMGEAPDHPHNAYRQTFLTIDGRVQPAPAPRFSRTPGAVQAPPAPAGAHTREALVDWGFSAAEVTDLERRRVIVDSHPD